MGDIAEQWRDTYCRRDYKLRNADFAVNSELYCTGYSKGCVLQRLWGNARDNFGKAAKFAAMAGSIWRRLVLHRPIDCGLLILLGKVRDRRRLMRVNYPQNRRHWPNRRKS